MGLGLKQIKAERDAALQERLATKIAAVAAAMPKEVNHLPPPAPLEVKHSSHVLAEYIHAQWGGVLTYEDSLLLVQQVFQGVADYLFHTGSILLPTIGTLKIAPRMARVFRTFDGLTRQKDAYKTLTISSSRSVRRILDNSKTRIIASEIEVPVEDIEETDSLLDDVVVAPLEEEEVFAPLLKIPGYDFVPTKEVKAPKAPVAKKVEAPKAPVAKKVEAPKAPVAKKVEAPKAPVAKKVEAPKAPVAKKVEAPKASTPRKGGVMTPEASTPRKGGVMTPTPTPKKGEPASGGAVFSPVEETLPKGGQVSPKASKTPVKKKKKKLRGVLPSSNRGTVISHRSYGGKLIE